MDGTPPKSSDPESTGFSVNDSNTGKEGTSSDSSIGSNSRAQELGIDDVGDIGLNFGSVPPPQQSRTHQQEATAKLTDDVAVQPMKKAGHSLGIARRMKQALSEFAMKTFILPSSQRPDFTPYNILGRCGWQPSQPSAQGTAGHEQLQVDTGNNRKIDAILFKQNPDGLEARGGQKIILYCNSNGEITADHLRNKEQRNVGPLQLGEDLGADVMLFDYGGTGKNHRAGPPTLEGCVQDCVATAEKLLEEGYKAENIVIYGRSLGGGVALEAAKQLTSQNGEFQQANVVVERSFDTLTTAVRHLKTIPSVGGTRVINKLAVTVLKKLEIELPSNTNAEGLEGRIKLLNILHPKDLTITPSAQFKGSDADVSLEGLEDNWDGVQRSDVGRRDENFMVESITGEGREAVRFESQGQAESVLSELSRDGPVTSESQLAKLDKDIAGMSGSELEIWVKLDKDPNRPDQDPKWTRINPRIDRTTNRGEIVYPLNGDSPIRLDNLKDASFTLRRAKTIPQSKLSKLFKQAKDNNQLLHVDIGGKWKLVEGISVIDDQDRDKKVIAKGVDGKTLELPSHVEYKLFDKDYHNAPLQLHQASYKKVLDQFNSKFGRSKKHSNP